MGTTAAWLKALTSARANEARAIAGMNRTLDPLGYRVESVGNVHTVKPVSRRGQGASLRRNLARAGVLPKRLKCPHCERKFGHQLPLARHVTATHGKTYKGAAARRR